MSSRSPKDGKRGSLKASQKSEVDSPKSEDEIKQPPAADRPAPTELQTENRPPQTEQMEVHHHPDVEKKGLKEYLLEGLMIFIAVMMGFFAESLREHIADHEREQQYMESLARDLALDTVALKAGFPVKEQRLAAIDSVFLFFESHPDPKPVQLTN